MVEGTARIRLSESWEGGVGAFWGTFAAEVPEFEVFAPRDHEAWLDYNMLFGELRYFVRDPSDAVRPFV